MNILVSQSAFAQALLDPAAPLPANVGSARGESDPARFAVYRNNVYVGLTSALARRFPVTARLVGDEFFTGMARVYAAREKPRSPLMFEYGDTFAEFVSGFEPASALPYLADVSRLEVAWSRAYHAADAKPLSIGDFSAIDPAMLARVKLVLHPSASLVDSSYPAGSIWQAHQSTEVSAVRAAGPELVLVVRPQMQVNVCILPPGPDRVFARAVAKGETLGEAAIQAMADSPSFDFGGALVGLLSLGAIAAIEISTEEAS